MPLLGQVIIGMVPMLLLTESVLTRLVLYEEKY